MLSAGPRRAGSGTSDEVQYWRERGRDFHIGQRESVVITDVCRKLIKSSVRIGLLQSADQGRWTGKRRTARARHGATAARNGPPRRMGGIQRTALKQVSIPNDD